MKAIAKSVAAAVGLVVLAFVLAPSASRPADAQVAMWTSCRNVCMRSCQWDKRVMGLPADDDRVTKVGNQCYESAECKKLHDYFAPSDPAIDRDAKTAAVRLGQCKKCAASGRPGRCAVDLFGISGTGGRSYGGSIYGGSRYGGRDPIGAFARCFEQSVRDRIAEGYYVKNYSFVRSVRMAAGGNPFADKSRGGRSGEYGEWGVKWLKPCADTFFPGALVDELVIEQTSAAHKKRVDDSALAIYEANHRATRVVLPDGRRFVADYWAGVGAGAGQLQTQTAWVTTWRERIGDAVVLVSDDEVALKKAVGRLGPDKGFAQFRKQLASRKHATPELWIQSWQREPW